MKRFSHIQISHFDNCEDCLFNKFVETERQDFQECDYTGSWIIEYSRVHGDKDNRNSDGVLDDCPFLKQNNITDEE